MWPLLLRRSRCARRAAGGHCSLPVLAVRSRRRRSRYAVHHVARSRPSRRTSRAPARAWELALGGAAGRRAGRAAARAARPRRRGLGRRRRRSPPPRVAFDAGTPMPGPAALLPVLGAAALLAAGTSARRGAARRARWPRWRRCGASARISYAWYVWHWPVLVFAAPALGPAVAPAEGVAVSARLARARRWSRTAGSRSRCGARTLHAAPPAGIARRGAGRARAGGRVGRRAVGEPVLAAGARCRPRRPGRRQLARTGEHAAVGDGAAAAPARRGRRPRRARTPTAAWSTSAPTARRRASTATATPARPSCCSATRTRCRLFPALERIALRRRWRLVQPDQGAAARRSAVPVVSPLSRRAIPGVRRRGASTRCGASRRRAAGAGRRGLVGALPRCSTARGSSGGDASTRALGGGLRGRRSPGCAPPGHAWRCSRTRRGPPHDVPACVSGAIEGAAPLRVRARPGRRAGRGGQRRGRADRPGPA